MSDDEDEMREIRQQSKSYSDFTTIYGSRKRKEPEPVEEDDEDYGPARPSAEGDGDGEEVVPTSFGKSEPQVKNVDPFDTWTKVKKRKVIPAEVKEKPPLEKKPDPVYIFGVNMPDNKPPPKKSDDDHIEFEDLDNDPNPFQIPYTHEVVMRGHKKAVSALGLDPSGSRLVSGGYDFKMRFWDFNAMDMNFRSFREVEPEPNGNYNINTLEYSNSGDKILVTSASPQAKIFDRDGGMKVTFVKGYQYLTDVSHTKGHTSNITTGMWHPCDSEVVVTAAQDSSVRFWNINKDKEHKALVKVKNDKGQAKVTPTAIAIGGDGKYLLIASNDGSLQQWAADGPYNRPTGRISQAHMMGSETSSIEISRDFHTVITRGGDDTLKVWDIRKFTSPLKSFNNLPNKYMETDAKFSPDENVIYTGTSVFKNEGVGNLVFIDKKRLEIIKTLPASPASVISLLWHEDLNQIIAGCSDGSTHVFFNPEWSKKGALYCVQKAPKKVRVDDYETTRPIQTPNSLEMFKAAPSARRQREKARKDPVKSHKPEVPALGAGSGGRLGSSLTAYIMKDLVPKVSITEDPREALAKYADDAEKNPFWFRAYKDKPKMFDETKDDEKK